LIEKLIYTPMITSVKNPKIQWVKRLQNKSKERQENRVCVVEGVRLVEEAHASNWRITNTFVSETLSVRGQRIVDEIRRSETQIEVVSENVLRAISDTKSPQGIVAIIELNKLPLPRLLDFVLILDHLSDPGNMGTILRTCAAANVQAVFLTKGCVDVYSPKVLRAGMGAQFRVPIKAVNWDEIRAHIHASNLHVFLSSASIGEPYYQVDFQQPLALIIGSESQGVSEIAAQHAESKVMIPMPGGGESLNAAVATGILLFEIARQKETNL
jgi:TrmH family RNA methyltransferase